MNQLAGMFVLLAGCSSAAPTVAAGVGQGCVGVVAGKEFSCTELDLGMPAADLLAFGQACNSTKIVNLRGRLIAHCPATDIVADCRLDNEHATLRYYRKEMSDDAERGARLGCKVRGGTYTPR